jgi:outer membrane protein assembly factor BamA
LGSAPPALSTNPIKDGLYNYQFEKPGEILLEGSVELRSKLVGFVNGALFVDVGNVWSFKQQSLIASDGTTSGNTKFRSNTFYKEFGVGTGFGLRFDFTFLILCFDVGIKMYDPSRPSGDKFVLPKARFFKPYAKQLSDGTYINLKEPVIYNIGIGYPF